MRTLLVVTRQPSLTEALGAVLDAIIGATTQDNEDVASLRQLLDRVLITNIAYLPTSWQTNILPFSTAVALHKSAPLSDMHSKLSASSSALIWTWKRLLTIHRLEPRDQQNLPRSKLGEVEMPVVVQKNLMARILAK